MSKSAWFSYIGEITGVIGAITGIFGAITGFISYRRSERDKKLGLRKELRIKIDVIRMTIGGVFTKLEKAKHSKERVTSATGQRGALMAWLSQWTSDLDTLKALKEKLPSPDIDYSKFSEIELENTFTEINNIGLNVNQISERCEESLVKDDLERKRIQDDHRAVMQARISKGMQ